MNQFLIILLFAVIAAFLVLFFIKSAIKVAIAIFIILTVLRIGWIWSGDEIMGNLMLDRVINDEYQAVTEYFVKEYAKRRDAHSVVNAQEVENIVLEMINNTPGNMSKALDSIDKEKLIEDISEQLEQMEEYQIEKGKE